MFNSWTNSNDYRALYRFSTRYKDKLWSILVRFEGRALFAMDILAPRKKIVVNILAPIS
jgi:hypothetical protein